MHTVKSRLLHLYESSVLSRTKIKKLLQLDSTLSSLYKYSTSQFASLLNLPKSKASALSHYLHTSPALPLPKGVQAITLLDDHYPLMLRFIKDPPLVLYALGDTSLLKDSPALSVVGTRYPTKQAFPIMVRILQPLIEDKWTLVSGMARGIDSFAHKLAIDHGGKTIAVLGGGFDYIYPKENERLFQELASSQLVLSEYPPSTRPQRYYFPERNRIISGLGFGTLVIEAKEKSGSLITVEQALDQGREVFAVPGSPLDPQSHGCHKMIQDGAKLVQNTYDLQLEWELERQKWSRIRSK
ncbi:DNA-processing protein DprA [Radiobacillus kanasensis]|uniref:DNA-processing protein DprA n=1 Tax=Radiobacillus kanasensis TaxID=2844358 RepID=UPI001E2EDD10|nr:DNA-processing protein DprA [Radiobacillus kanasensis]UFU01015.1 DNA-processing protein DprA [Radiobacillus kanasensis]